MEEIKVGEYVRTKEGLIGKIEQINKEPTDDTVIYVVTDNWVGMYEEIVKHSKDIRDLIEVGDYVNGQEVVTVYGYDKDGNDRDELGIIETDVDYAYGVYLEDINIKSIVTKEQFNQVKYEV